MFLGSTRALLDQHMRECTEDRKRTAEQFVAMTTQIGGVKGTVERLLKVVYVGAGIGLTIAALGSPMGQRAVGIVIAPPSAQAER